MAQKKRYLGGRDRTAWEQGAPSSKSMLYLYKNLDLFAMEEAKIAMIRTVAVRESEVYPDAIFTIQDADGNTLETYKNGVKEEE